MRNYQDFINRKKTEYGDKFDDSELNKSFIKYFENQKRIKVDFGYEVKTGIIGITTGWKPCFLLMLTSRSIGSSHTISNKDKVIAIKYDKQYVNI